MTIRLKIDPAKPNEKTLTEAGKILRTGGVVAFPTETFYGLGADARREAAVEKIFRLKGRAVHNPISVIVDSAAPHTAASITPARSISQAIPIASTPEAQAEATDRLGPRKP